jgi:curved DNA-binding protein CbpA
MKSAYHILGVPGNANAEDIELAFSKAQSHYSPERMAEDASVAERFTEVRNAYKILRDADSRAAHDRKLAFAGSPTARRVPQTVMVTEEPSWLARPMTWIVMLVLALVVGIGYASIQRQEAAKENAAKALAAKELADKQLQAQEASAEQQRQAAIEREKRQSQYKADNDERRLRYDAQATANRANYAQQAAQESQSARYAAEQRDAERRDNEQRNQRERDASEARQRVELDKRRIRELCYQQYRRPDC